MNGSKDNNDLVVRSLISVEWKEYMAVGKNNASGCVVHDNVGSDGAKDGVDGVVNGDCAHAFRVRVR